MNKTSCSSKSPSGGKILIENSWSVKLEASSFRVTLQTSSEWSHKIDKLHQAECDLLLTNTALT